MPATPITTFNLVFESQKTLQKTKGRRFVSKALEGGRFIDKELPDDTERVAS
jgi:hypothetical protein